MDGQGNDNVSEAHETEQKRYEYDVFISYRRKTGLDLARTIKYWFEAKGINAFLDVSELEAGEWNKDLEKAIAGSKYFLLLLTGDALSPNVCDEIRWAKKTHKTNTIIPVSVDVEYREPEILKGQQGFPLISRADMFEGSLSALVQKSMKEFNERVAKQGKNSDQFLSSIRWYKRNDGKIDDEERELLRNQAQKLGINEDVRDILINQVEREWATECAFSDEKIAPYFKSGDKTINPDEHETLQDEARKFGISQDRLNELIFIASEKATRKKRIFFQTLAVLLSIGMVAFSLWRYKTADEVAQNKWVDEKARMNAEIARVKGDAERVKAEAEKRAEVASSVRANSEKAARLSNERMQKELDAANAASASAAAARQKAEKALAEANAAFETERAAYVREREELKKRDAADLKKMEERAAAAEASSADKAAELSRERERIRQLQEEKAALQKKLDEARVEGMHNL